MYLDFVFSVLRNFAMLTGVFVFIKNVLWVGEFFLFVCVVVVLGGFCVGNMK